MSLRSKRAVSRSSNKISNFPANSRTAHRLKFLSRQQKRNEPLFDFVQSLETLSKVCCYGNLRESLVKDAMIMGLNNPMLRDALLKEDPKTSVEALAAAEKFANNYEGEERIIIKTDPEVDLSIKDEEDAKESPESGYDDPEDSDFVGKEKKTPGRRGRKPKATVEKSKPKRHRNWLLDRRLDCATCGREFKSPSLRERHEISAHSTATPWQCNLCDKAFKLQIRLKIHVRKVHEETGKFQCDLCNVEVVSKTGIIRHLAGIHGMGSLLICESCGKSCADKHSLRVHTHRYHLGSKGFFQCPACPKSFFSKDHLTGHLDHKHPELPGDKRQCSLCGNMFHNLPKHESYCPKREPETCHLCGKMYRSRHKFKTHLKFCERGEAELYACQFCGQNYRNFNSFKVHERNCEKNEGVCNICGRDFPDRISFKNHMVECRKTVGNGPSSVCVFCGVDYKKTESLDAHLRECQNRNWEKVFRCPFCSKRFLESKSLNQHVERATKNNGICGIKTNRDPSRKVFTCEMCHKAVSTMKSLKRHLKRHTDAKKYNCDLCDKSYTQTNSLKYHILRKHAFEQSRIDFNFKM